MHARQGDGEICGGGGIETGGSVMMKVELSPKPEGMTWPRIENDTHIMTTGIEKPAEDAFRIALSEMILWLEADYGMTQGEAFIFLAQCLRGSCHTVRKSHVLLCMQSQPQILGLSRRFAAHDLELFGEIDANS